MAPAATVKIKLPVLARLILGELAERRGQSDEQLLVELIHRQAVAELSQPCNPETGVGGHVAHQA